MVAIAFIIILIITLVVWVFREQLFKRNNGRPLWRCKQCSEIYEDSHPRCPKCGLENKPKNIKFVTVFDRK